MKNDVLVLAGAAGGAVLGYATAIWLARHGYLGLVVPGGFIGLGAGFFRGRSIGMPIFCGLLAVVTGFYTDWRIEPFVADGSLKYYVGHLSDVRPVTLLMVTVGVVIAFWVPFRRRHGAPGNHS